MVTRRERRKNRSRISNKLLISLILLSLITIRTGVNTYSWFTSSASSQLGQITVASFGLRLDNNSTQYEVSNIEPGVATDDKVISFTNIGSLNMLLKGELTINSAKFNDTDSKKKAYKIIAQVYKLINPNDADTENNRIYIHSTVDRKKGETIDNFNQGLINELNSDQNKALDESNTLVFKPNDKLICRFQLLLDIEAAANEHQGDKVTAIFNLTAKQNADGILF